MAWPDDLQDASFRDVEFEVLNVRDGAARATASHAYPYVDGEDIEDHGRAARTTNLTAVLYGDDYLVQLQKLLKVLDQAGTGTLVHPVFGVMKSMQSLGYDVSHEADPSDYCTISLQFKQSTTGAGFFTKPLVASPAKATVQAEVIRSTASAAHSKKIGWLAALRGMMSRLNYLRSDMVNTLGEMAGIVNETKSLAVDLITYPLTFASQVVSVLASAADLRAFDKTVLISDWRSLRADIDNIVKLPANVAAPGANPDDVALTTTLVTSAAAAQLVTTAANLLESEASDPVLSPAEVSEINRDVRSMVQSAIAQTRAIYDADTAQPIIDALREAAAAIQDAAREVIDLRPPLMKRTVDAAGNLHLIAHRWYGDASRAAELARLNPQIRNPNLIQAGEVLHAYAE